MTPELQTGIFYALFAGTLWGISPLLLKRGLKFADVSTATVIEQCVSVTFLAGLAAYTGEFAHLDFTGTAFWAFFLAGAVGASFGKVFYYKGIDKVGASRATSIKNGSPLLTAFLAVIFLGEDINAFVIAGVCLIVLGIASLSRAKAAASTGETRLKYLLFPLIAALCFGINPIFKKVGVDAASVPILGALITQVTALVFMLGFAKLIALRPQWKPVPLTGICLLSLSGIAEALGSLFTFIALIYGPAALLSPIWRISPLVTFALAHFTLRGIEVVTLRDGMAATLIVAGVFVLSQA
jgi:uncharacterized membrane protein